MLTRFLCHCSGANWAILKDCRSQQAKYAGMGATILLTSLLASVSGGYALYHIFAGADHRTLYAVCFGILWGITIFNLDRLIILSVKKEKQRKPFREFFQVLPRIILAVFISLVIAKPLEVRIFEESIEEHLRMENREEVNSQLDRVRGVYDSNNLIQQNTQMRPVIDSIRFESTQGVPNSPEYQELTQSINDSKDDRDGYQRNRDIQSRAFDAVLARSKVASINDLPQNTEAEQNEYSLAQKYQNQKNSYQRLLNSAQASINKLRSARQLLVDDYRQQMSLQLEHLDSTYRATQIQINKIDSARKVGEAAAIRNTPQLVGLMAQIDALGRITAYKPTMEADGTPITVEGRVVNNSLFWSNIIITLLFLVLETAPIFVKLMMRRGIYEDIVERTEDNEAEIALHKKAQEVTIRKEAHLAAKEEKNIALKKAIKYWVGDRWTDEIEQVRTDHEFMNLLTKIFRFNPIQTIKPKVKFEWPRVIAIAAFISVALALIVSLI